MQNPAFLIHWAVSRAHVWLLLAGGCTFNINGALIVNESDGATELDGGADGGDASMADGGMPNCEERDLLFTPTVYAPDQDCGALRESQYCIVLYGEPNEESPRYHLGYVGLDTGLLCDGPDIGPLLGASGSMGRLGDELFVCAGRPGPLSSIAMSDGSIKTHDYPCYGVTDFGSGLLTEVAVPQSATPASPTHLATVSNLVHPFSASSVAWPAALDELASDGNLIATSDGSSTVSLHAFPAGEAEMRTGCGGTDATFTAMDLMTTSELVRADRSGALTVFDSLTCTELRSFSLEPSGAIPVALTCLAGTPSGVIEPWIHEPASPRDIPSPAAPPPRASDVVLSSTCSGTLSRYRASLSKGAPVFVLAAEHRGETAVAVRDDRRNAHTLVLAEAERWRLEVTARSGLERVIVSNDRPVDLVILGRPNLTVERYVSDRALSRTPALAYASGGTEELLNALQDNFGLALTEFAACAPDASGALRDPSFVVTNHLPTCR